MKWDIKIEDVTENSAVFLTKNGTYLGEADRINDNLWHFDCGVGIATAPTLCELAEKVRNDEIQDATGQNLTL